MEKKTKSKAMHSILERLKRFGPFEILIFTNNVILDKSVEEWPPCDFFISFYSSGFPLKKAIEYVRLRKPFCVNNVCWQQVLLDRRLVLRMLDKFGVPTPKRLVVSRDGGPTIPEGLEAEIPKEATESEVQASIDPNDSDKLVVGDQVFQKPFVEKPVSGENHDVYIYYDSQTGGGGRRLFRKVHHCSVLCHWLSRFVGG